jgi:hypothetical protein
MHGHGYREIAAGYIAAAETPFDMAGKLAGVI